MTSDEEFLAEQARREQLGTPLPQLRRRIKVTVYERILEDTVIEIEVPDEVDLDDDEARLEFLERTWCDGEYKKLDLESQLQVTDRDFSEPEVLA